MTFVALAAAARAFMALGTLNTLGPVITCGLGGRQAGGIARSTG